MFMPSKMHLVSLISDLDLGVDMAKEEEGDIETLFKNTQPTLANIKGCNHASHESERLFYTPQGHLLG